MLDEDVVAEKNRYGLINGVIEVFKKIIDGASPYCLLVDSYVSVVTGPSRGTAGLGKILSRNPSGENF